MKELRMPSTLRVSRERSRTNGIMNLEARDPFGLKEEIR